MAKKEDISTIEHKSELKPDSTSVLRLLIAATLICGYLLPNTYWSEHSISTILQKTQSQQFGTTGYAWGVWIACFVGTVLFSFRSRLDMQTMKVWGCVVLYASACVVSSLPPGRSVVVSESCFAILAPLGFGLLAARICNTTIQVIKIFVVLVTIQCGYAFWYYVFRDEQFISGTVHRIGGTYNHPTGIATVTLVSVLGAVYLVLSSDSRRLSLLWAICALSSFIALYLTWTRGCTLALLFGLPVMLWHSTRNKRIVAASSLLLTLLVFMTWYHRVDGLQNANSSSRSLSSHQTLMRNGIDVFRRNWLTGVGIGELAVPNQPSQDFAPTFNTGQVFPEPKNQLIFWLCEMGLSGGLLFVLFTVSLARTVSSSYEPCVAFLKGAWVAMIVAVSCDTLFGLASRPYGTVTFATLIGATLLLSKSNKNVGK